jgi:hypothetical protein
MSRDDRIEGHWRWHAAPDLPMPVTDVDWPGRADFLTKLATVEAAARQRHMKGSSTCRVCGETNGSSSFTFGGWEWPDGFVHYLRDHGVRPTADFEAFVTGFDTGPLPKGAQTLPHRRPPSFPHRNHMRGRP